MSAVLLEIKGEDVTDEIEMEVLSLSGSSEDGTWRQPCQLPDRVYPQVHLDKTEVGCKSINIFGHNPLTRHQPNVTYTIRPP